LADFTSVNVGPGVSVKVGVMVKVLVADTTGEIVGVNCGPKFFGMLPDIKSSESICKAPLK